MANNDDDDYDAEDDNAEFDLQESASNALKARRELEKRLEMKRLRELLDYDEFDDAI